MHHFFKGTLISALCSASIISHAAVFKTYNEEGNFFRSHLNAELSENLITDFKNNTNSKDGGFISIRTSPFITGQPSI